MIDFFKWITTLTMLQAWSLFGLICLLMSLMPLFPFVKRILVIKFTNEKAEINDFTWRSAPDQLMTILEGNSYYLKTRDINFLLTGSKIILNWNVSGAYRIDIEGLGKRVKGNTANVIVKNGMNSFVIIAYTLNGKLRKELNINPSLIKSLKTFNLSKENQFNQPFFHNQVARYSQSIYNGENYTKLGIEKLKIVEKTGKEKNEFENRIKSIFQKKNYLEYKFINKHNIQKEKILKNIEKQNLIFINSFNPENYNQAIFQYNNSINKK